jgi:hypothetical protein
VDNGNDGYCIKIQVVVLGLLLGNEMCYVLTVGCREARINLHSNGATTQKTTIFVLTAVRTSNPTLRSNVGETSWTTEAVVWIQKRPTIGFSCASGVGSLSDPINDRILQCYYILGTYGLAFFWFDLMWRFGPH